MAGKFFICIGRQLGSGGHQIGEKLAKELNISFYDKELIEIASKESGLGKEIFEQADETTRHSLFAGLFGLRSSFDEIYINDYLRYETLFKIQSDTIRNLAEKKSCLFVGRCADYVLRENPDCLSIFICANKEDRIKRISGLLQVPENQAQELIKKMDRKRSEYYNYYSNKIWGAAESYHLSVNSSVLGIDRTTDIIKQFVKSVFNL